MDLKGDESFQIQIYSSSFIRIGKSSKFQRAYVICWHLATPPSEYLEIGHAATKGPGSRTFGEVGRPLIGVELSAPQRTGNSAGRSFENRVFIEN